MEAAEVAAAIDGDCEGRGHGKILEVKIMVDHQSRASKGCGAAADGGRTQHRG